MSGGRPVGRKAVVAALASSLEPLGYALALWEGGSPGFGRTDEWSDLDLYLVVEDGRVEAAFRATERSLRRLSGIELRYRMPEPAWHGHSQCFYRLKNASPFLYLDYLVMQRSAKDKFLQFGIHGRPVVLFDKAGIVRDEPVDGRAFGRRLRDRLVALKVLFELFRGETLKELARGNDLEAMAFYLSTTYRPLVEALRMRYSPLHHNYHAHYIHYELPPSVLKRLRKLTFIADAGELRRRHAEAGKWFQQIVRDIEAGEKGR